MANKYISEAHRLRPAVSYYGGKQRLALKIAATLPMRTAYVEPFTGVGSVLLQRPISEVEIVNDKSLLVVSFWREIRDHPTGFQYMMEHTPHSRVEHEEAHAVSQNPADYSQRERAWAFAVLAIQSVAGNMVSPNSWKRRLGDKASAIDGGRWERVGRIAERIAAVQVECREASSILEMTRDRDDVVSYIDPPYRGSDTGPYLERVGDFADLLAMILDQRGAVAVSGYAGTWQELDAAGWHRTEWAATMAAAPSQADGIDRERTEVLWTNFEPLGQIPLIGD